MGAGQKRSDNPKVCNGLSPWFCWFLERGLGRCVTGLMAFKKVWGGPMGVFLECCIGGRLMGVQA